MIVSLILVKYRKPFIPLALLAMAVHRIPLWINKKCRFWKLMGCGKNGTFSLNPDWQRWALLCCWKDREDAELFIKHSFISSWWQKFTSEQWIVICAPLSSHGSWDRKKPFETNDNLTGYSGPVAVLTRATIRLNRLKNFWSNVNLAANAMSEAKGYIFSSGIGEAPFYRQATFSIWETLDDVKNYAYRSAAHSDVIRKTRQENWYSEELFARFQILDSSGTFNGKNPLKHLYTK